MDEDQAATPEAPGEGGQRNSNEPPIRVGDTKRRGRRADTFTGLLIGIVSGALVSFFLTATGHASEVAADHFWEMPSCSNPQWLMQVPDDSVFSSAYYFQQDNLPHFQIMHAPGSTVDGDVRTAWLQAWPSPSSRSNYIEWAFPSNYNIRLICVVDGWTEDSDTYNGTLPIGNATIYTTDSAKKAPAIGAPAHSRNCPKRRVSFKDYFGGYTYEWQPISFACDTNNVILYIRGVSRSSIDLRLHKHTLSEIKFYDSHRWLTGLSEIRFYYCPAILCFLP